MIKEERTVFLAILTLLLYVFIHLIEKGIFAFPYPLNEFVLFIVSVTFLYWHYKKYNRLILLFVLSILFRLLSQDFIWSLFLSEQSYVRFTDILLPDIFYFLYLLHLFLFSFFFVKKENNKLSLYIRFIILGLLIGCLFFPALEFFVLFILALFGFIFKKDTPIYLLPVLFFILEVFKVLTYILNSNNNFY